MARGRTSLYETVIKPHLKEIADAKEAGATDKEIADAFGISVSALNEYKKRHAEFKGIFTRGRARVIIKVRGALLKKALGFEYEEEKRVGRKDASGADVITVEKYKKYSQPDATAAAMILRNYDPDWRDNDQTAVNIKKEEARLKKAIAESQYFDFDFDDKKKKEEKK